MNLKQAKSKGKRPPPWRGTGYLFILLILGFSIAFGNVMTGGSSLPVDPNGPDGAPTLAPGEETDTSNQKVIIPPDVNLKNDKGNLQLYTFQVCNPKTAIYFLIDVSGSMDYKNGIKRKNEQKALRRFTEKMKSTSVIGFQTFSDNRNNNIQTLIDLTQFTSDAKSDTSGAIDQLKSNGATYTRDAMIVARDNLANAINSNKFPGYKYSLIFLTDGVPEINDNDPSISDKSCRIDYKPADRCFANGQDPRIPNNIATEIKNLGVDIYSIVLTTDVPSDIFMQPHLEELLKDVASKPLSQYYSVSRDGTNLESILNGVFENICGQ